MDGLKDYDAPRVSPGNPRQCRLTVLNNSNIPFFVPCVLFPFPFFHCLVPHVCAFRAEPFGSSASDEMHRRSRFFVRAFVALIRKKTLWEARGKRCKCLRQDSLTCRRFVTTYPIMLSVLNLHARTKA